MSARDPRDTTRYEERIGSLVGAWRVEGLLGSGSTSAVYDASHVSHSSQGAGERAALKILHRHLCSDPVVCQRFLREAHIADTVRHRAIVPVREGGVTDDGCGYLVLDRLDGETLDAFRIRRGGRLSIDDLGPLADDLMSALAAVHAVGIVHRDLKPQNVFLTVEGYIKLLDFGTARVFDRRASHLSMQGLVIGTPAFMSPEQSRGSRDEIDACSDVWSLGATLFTLLTGEYVHVGRDAHARLLAAASRQARVLAEVLPSVDAATARVIDRALAFDKKERWPDVTSMRQAFRDAVHLDGPMSGVPRATGSSA